MKLLSQFKRNGSLDALSKPCAALNIPLPKRNKPLSVHIEAGSYVIEGTIFDTDRLIITFENAAINRTDPTAKRSGWGAQMFTKQRRSHLCVKAKFEDWYQGGGLSDAFTNLRQSGFLDAFDHRLTYGASMGAFAAIAFADQLKATDVLAVSPQTTLDPRKTPWDKRFKEALKQSWDGPNNDAVGKSLGAKRVICVYDRQMVKERRHMARLKQDNIIHVMTPFMGHGVSHALIQLGANSTLLSFAYGDIDDLSKFYSALRGRRTLPRYYRTILAKRRVKSTPAFAKAITDAQARHMRTDIK